MDGAKTGLYITEQPLRNGWRFDADDAIDALYLRSVYRAYLARHARQGCDLDAAELIFGELVGNVVSHAPGPISIIVEWVDEYSVLHVIDYGGGFEYVPLEGEYIPTFEERGRGLSIVAHMASRLTFHADVLDGSHARALLPVYRYPSRHATESPAPAFGGFRRLLDPKDCNSE